MKLKIIVLNFFSKELTEFTKTAKKRNINIEVVEELYVWTSHRVDTKGKGGKYKVEQKQTTEVLGLNNDRVFIGRGDDSPQNRPRQ